MKKKRLLLILLAILMLAVFVPPTGAMTHECEDFANRAILGTHSSYDLAIDCLSSSLWDFMDLIF